MVVKTDKGVSSVHKYRVKKRVANSIVLAKLMEHLLTYLLTYLLHGAESFLRS